MTKIVFFGVGFMGQMAHLRNYVVTPDCEVVAIVEGRPSQGKKVAERYGVPNVFTNLAELKASGIEFDGFVASQPYTNHKNVLPELFSFGKPVFIEKPVALSVENGEKIATAERETGAKLMVGYHKRSDPAMEFVKPLIEEWKKSGEFGAFKYIRATMPAGDWITNGGEGFINITDDPWPEGPPHEGDVEYYKNAENNGYYNVFVNYYVHQINALRFLLGEDYTATYAEPSKTLFVGKSDSGIPVTIELSPFNNTVDWKESYIVCFEKGYIEITLPAPLILNQSGTVTVMEDNGAVGAPRTWSPNLPYVHAMKNQAKNFVEVCKGNRDVTCNSADAVKDLEVIKEYVKLLDV